MKVRYTKPLKIYIDQNLAYGEIALHPNDAFDLGLINLQNDLEIFLNNFFNQDRQLGRVIVKNSCPTGTVQISQKYWEHLDKQKETILALKDKKLVFVRVNKA